MSSMYGMFETDKKREREGIYLDYGSFRIKISRAGGDNKRFSKVLEGKTKPHRRAIQTDMLDPIVADRLLKETYAEAVVLDWETKDDKGKWKSGIEGREGEILPFCNANVCEAFVNLPELFKDVQEQANKVALFRRDVLEADAKN